MEFLLTKIKENLNEQMLLLTISNPRKAEEVCHVLHDAHLAARMPGHS